MCQACRYWSRGCDGPAVGKEWAQRRGYVGPVAPQHDDRAKCPAFVADKRATSRTTTPVVR